MATQQQLKEIFCPQTAEHLLTALKAGYGPYKKLMDNIIAMRLSNEVALIKLINEQIMINQKQTQADRSAVLARAEEEQAIEEKNRKALDEAMTKTQKARSEADIKAFDEFMQKASPGVVEATAALTQFEQALKKSEERLQKTLDNRESDFNEKIDHLSDKELTVYGPNNQPLKITPQEMKENLKAAYKESSQSTIPAIKMYTDSVVAAESNRSEIPLAPPPPMVKAETMMMQKIDLLAHLRFLETCRAQFENTSSEEPQQIARQRVMVGGKEEAVPLNPLIALMMANRGKGNVLDRFPTQSLAEADLQTGREFISGLEKVRDQKIVVLNMTKGIDNREDYTPPRPGK